MRKTAIAATAGATVLSVVLAAQPKAMACDAWLCRSSHCAPAKYAKVRTAPTMLPLFASPTFGAAVIEGGIGFGVFLVGAAIARRRRTATTPTGPRSDTEPVEP